MVLEIKSKDYNGINIFLSRKPLHFFACERKRTLKTNCELSQNHRENQFISTKTTKN